MEKLVSLCKRRGFVFQSSEIYGGLNGAWDYGPLGVDLLRNIKDEWWKLMTYREDVVGIDAAILMHPRVWEASGHVENFTDPMVDCKKCKSRYREDMLTPVLICDNCGLKIGYSLNSDEKRKIRKLFGDEEIQQILNTIEHQKTCPRCHSEKIKIIHICPTPNCGSTEFTETRKFNLMFKTFIGPVEDSSNVVYLRPETAQGIFVNFLNVQSSSRQKLPFGIAQIGKAFRNEINTKNFLFRTREFEQMEMQYFVKPGTDERWFEYWREQRMQWFLYLGMKQEKLRFQRHEGKHLAHYARDAYDIEYEFPFGWGEIEGIHNRTDYDLTRHEEFSGKSLKFFDEEAKEKFIPYIIETSAGCDRTLLTCLVDAYAEEELENDSRTVLRLSPKIAPVKAGIFPLVKRDGMPEVAMKITDDLKKHMMVFYDEAGAVGRRYRRQDEAGTPYCVTVDSQTLQDNTVTVRERDSMQQDRINMNNVLNYLRDRIF